MKKGTNCILGILFATIIFKIAEHITGFSFESYMLIFIALILMIRDTK